MPTPEEVALYHAQLAELNRRHPGGSNIVLDVGEEADALHPVDEARYDRASEAQLTALQEALDREPTGPEPPPVLRP